VNTSLAILICSVLFAFASPRSVTGGVSAALDSRVADLASVLNPSYGAELSWRLARYSEGSGYDIYIALIENQNEFKALAAPLLRSGALEKSWSKGFVLLSIGPYSRHATIVTSDNLRERFSHSGIINKIERRLRRVGEKHTSMEWTVEFAVDSVIGTIDPWLYVLPPAQEFPWGFHSELAEIMLFPLAPLSALTLAIVLMAFTSTGRLGALNRTMASGSIGLLIAIAEAFLLRQSGGISPAGLYYSGIAGFTVAAAVGALKPFWFEDKFTGKRSDAWWSGPVHFHWG
jgi:hypothetical protein